MAKATAAAKPPFHAPCVFNPLGASRELCVHMSAAARHASRCASISCTSPARRCIACVSAGSALLAADPVSGLCDWHQKHEGKPPENWEARKRHESPELERAYADSVREHTAPHEAPIRQSAARALRPDPPEARAEPVALALPVNASQPGPVSERIATLSKREREIIVAVSASDRSLSTLAPSTGLTANSLYMRMSSIYAKLGIHRAAHGQQLATLRREWRAYVKMSQ